MRRLIFSSSTLIVSTAAWTVVLGIGAADHSDVSVVLMALSMWVATVASIAGMVVARARWARRFGLAVAASHGAAALVTPVDLWWGLAAVLTAIAAVSIGGPWLDGIVRSRPSASGPPARVVLIALFLIGVPFALGIANGDAAPVLAVSLSALGAVFWFVRTLPGALVVVRALWPLIAIVLSYPMGFPAMTVSIALGIAVGSLAWHSSVRNSVHPLVEAGSKVPIPPELAPREVLDAADIDDRGRPR